MSKYFYNPEYCTDRATAVDYKRHEKISGLFEPAKVSDIPYHFSGNCYGDYCFNLKTKKVVKKEYYWKHDGAYMSIYESMPSSHMIYCLLCMYQCEVVSKGPEGYKGVWMIPIRHKETGQIIIFREWKGGFSLGCQGMFKPETDRDVRALLTLMINGKVLHPYDGTFAGTVA